MARGPKGKSPLAGNPKGVNKQVVSMYNSAGRTDKAHLTALYKQGVRGPKRLADALTARKQKGAPRAERNQRNRLAAQQATFDRAFIAASAGGRRRLRTQAGSGVDTRNGRGGVAAARASLEAYDARQATYAARREGRATAAAAAAAAASPRTGRRTGGRRTGGRRTPPAQPGR